ncbi:MAG: DUF4139 domain-containing protein [Cyclobacteriaceae bacterium]|nr:DUF4139 domain-containing protein [Cyclobacteriaceae bacterium]
MKLFLIALVMLPGFALSQSARPVDSKITTVTVFLNRAQITRQAQTTLPAGKSLVVLSGLSPDLDPQSISVAGKGRFLILGIGHHLNFLAERAPSKLLKTLQDSARWYERAIAQSNTQKEILSKEEQLIVSNQKINGNQNLTVAELKAMADFFRSRLGEIANSRLKEDERIVRNTERLARVQNQINEQTALQQRNTSDIEISVSADAAADANFEISYLVNQAGWIPSYDLRAINTSSPVQLQYKANVFQSSGEDWNAVKLILSTANPSQGGLKPELSPWYLDFYQPVVVRGYAMEMKSAAAPMAQREADKTAEDESSLSQFVTAVQTTLNTQFEIALAYSVPSGSKPTQVDIARHEVKASYVYMAAPKLDPNAFLMAKAVGWEELNLLPGEANIYFEGTFVGKTMVDPSAVKDTLAISLGRDKRVVIQREKVKDFSTRRTLGTSQRESYAWEISVRNTSPNAIHLIIEDQLPISQNSQIEVTALDLGGAGYDNIQGKLTWDLKLAPAETKKVSYRYEVKYPKGRQVGGL